MADCAELACANKAGRDARYVVASWCDPHGRQVAAFVMCQDSRERLSRSGVYVRRDLDGSITFVPPSAELDVTAIDA